MNTRALAQVNANRYDAVLFVGGHGVMWDFPNNSVVNAVGRNIWERGGIVPWPAALVDMTLSDGSYLIAGKQVTGFTNGEEQNLGRYPWLRRANRREIEIEAGRCRVHRRHHASVKYSFSSASRPPLMNRNRSHNSCSWR